MLHYNPKIDEEFSDDLPRLKELYKDLFSGGKAFRARLVKKIGKSIGLKKSDLELLGQTIEYIHSSSLLHDDLIDRSSMRRGKTTAWVKYGPESAVLAGDYLLAKVMWNLSERGCLPLIALTSQSILNLLEGEWLQDATQKSIETSFSQIQKIHELKTSSLFRWCFVAPFLLKGFAPDSSEIKKLEYLGFVIGDLLQRSDDLLDFNIRNSEAKNYLTDLKAGFPNSFLVFVSEYKNIKLSQEVYSIKAMDELKLYFNLEDWDEPLKEFDKKNQQLISEFLKTREEVKEFWPLDKGDLTSYEKLLNKVYFRT